VKWLESHGQILTFQILDEYGKELQTSKQGIISHFFFEYFVESKPNRLKFAVDAKENYKTTLGKEKVTPIPALPDDPDTIAKWAELDKIVPSFLQQHPKAERKDFEIFLVEDLTTLTESVKWYFYYLKKQRAKIGPNAKINFKLLTDAIRDKYYKSMAADDQPVKEKTPEEILNEQLAAAKKKKKEDKEQSIVANRMKICKKLGITYIEFIQQAELAGAEDYDKFLQELQQKKAS